MQQVSLWDMMRDGRAQEAIELMRQGYERDPSDSRTVELGIGCLWTEQYEAAWQHFRHAMTQWRWSNSTYPGFAGVAKWCMGEPGEAVKEWQAGLKVQYADSGGLGLTIPLTLYTAALLLPGVYPLDDAEKCLRTKRSAKGFDVPGYSSSRHSLRYILGEIDEAALMEACVWKVYGREESTQIGQWHASYYVGVAELAKGNVAGFRERMLRAVEVVENPALSSNFLTGCIWGPEYFMARHAVRGGR